jgi:hypothetical protein
LYCVFLFLCAAATAEVSYSGGAESLVGPGDVSAYVNTELYQLPLDTADPSVTAAASSEGLLYMLQPESEPAAPDAVPVTSNQNGDELGVGSGGGEVVELLPTVKVSSSQIREDAPEFVPRAASTTTQQQRWDPPQLVALPSGRNRNHNSWSAPANWADAPEFVPKGKLGEF